MQNKADNVILFPKWKSMLEEESLKSLKEKKFEEALDKLNELLRFRVDNHEIYMGKLICLMELAQFKEAQDLCEELIQQQSENYYHYLHIYLTILFKTNQFDLLMNQIESEYIQGEIPDMFKQQFEQLYDMSNEMQMGIVQENAEDKLEELWLAIDAGNYSRQWHLVQNLWKMQVTPPTEVIDLLGEEYIHPVIKTAIFEWLQDKNGFAEVAVDKFGLKIHAVPNEVEKLGEHGLLKQLILLIEDVEQTNPSLYGILKQLLSHYLYVRYPVLPPEDDKKYIATAVHEVGETYLNIHKKHREETNEKVDYYKNEIELCETLYLSIIEA